MKKYELDGKELLLCQKPFWLRWLIPDGFNVTLYPIIYCTKYVYEYPKIFELILIHEIEHLRQQRIQGKWKFLWKYLTNRSYRLQMESEAYAKQISLVPEGTNKLILINWASKMLASSEYNFAAKTEEEAKIQILIELCKLTNAKSNNQLNSNLY